MAEQPPLPLLPSLGPRPEVITPEWPLPMQYLGSKKRLAPQLAAALRQHLPHTTALVDLFGGTGAVSLAALDQRWRVHANDVQPYARMVLRSLLATPTDGLDELLWAVSALRSPSALLTGARVELASLLEEEERHLPDPDWQEYAAFCEATPLVQGTADEAARLQEERPWALFCTWYPNTYFGIRQCLELDALAELASRLPEGQATHLRAAAVAAMTYAVSSTTHLAQYLRPSSARAVKTLAMRRSISVVNRVLHSLDALRRRGPVRAGQVLGLDYLDALDALPLGPRIAVYADPPYFKEHYSRYYHVLDTFCLYDWPELTFNPRIGRTTEGRYRDDRIVSPFGKKARVRPAFRALMERCRQAGSPLAISYADSSLVSRQELEDMAREEGLGVAVQSFELMHSGQGQARHRLVQEQLFVLSPEPLVQAALGGLRQALSQVEPAHDTPAGLVHPYWARKPLNVLGAIIEALSEPGQAVLDPFMGSGTTLFAAASTGRPALGSDLSPLSAHLVRALVALGRDPQGSLDLLEGLFQEVAEQVLPWQAVGEGWFVERARYEVEGAYAHGAFTLQPTEQVVKELRDGRLRGRRVLGPGELVPLAEPPQELLSAPVDFDAMALRPNSRIAIPEGATAAHYFTPVARAAVNAWHRAVEARQLSREQRDLCRLFLSSALPLLRLSDRKASSQWPYWRPKRALTARNPVPVLRKRLQAFGQAAAWASEHLDAPVQVLLAAVQALPNQLEQRFALVLTDPPYADQAPYLEYADMGLRISLLEEGSLALAAEIVKTDAPSRKGDDAAYLHRLGQGMAAAGRMVATGGWLTFFYQDPRLDHWAALHRALVQEGLEAREVVPIPRQRRSMKTVTSPGRTLDGDLLVVWHRPERGAQGEEEGDPAWIRALWDVSEGQALTERAAALLRAAVVEGWIGELAQAHPTLASLEP